MKTRALSFVAILVLLSACSGGHVTMVYEKGRDVEGTSSEDMMNRLNLAVQNPKLFNKALTDLEAVPANFNWGSFWNENRKNTKIFFTMSLDEQKRFLALSSKICLAPSSDEAINAFGRFVLESRRGVENLVMASSECPAALEAGIVLDSLDLIDKSENAGSSTDYLIHEMEKRHSSWHTDPLLQTKIAKVVDTMIESSIKDARVNLNEEGVSAAFANLARMEELLDVQGVDTQFLKDKLAKPLVESLAASKNHAESSKLIDLLKSTHPRLAVGAELWRHGVTFDKDSPLLKNPLDLLESARSLCPTQDSTALMDDAGYARFIDFIRRQPTATQLFLDEQFPCLEQASPEAIRTIADLISRELYPRGLLASSASGDHESVVIGKRFMHFLARSFAGVRGANPTEVATFMADNTRRDAVAKAIMVMTENAGSETIRSEENWRETAKVFQATYSQLKNRKTAVATELGRALRASIGWEDVLLRSELLGDMIWTMREDLATIAAKAPAALPNEAKAIFGAANYDENKVVKFALKMAFRFDDGTPIKKSKFDRIFDGKVELNLISRLAILGRFGGEDVMAYEDDAVQKIAEEFSKELVNEDGSIDTTFKAQFLDKARDLTAELARTRGALNPELYEALTILARSTMAIPQFTDDDRAWLQDLTKISYPDTTKFSRADFGKNGDQLSLVLANHLSEIRLVLTALQVNATEFKANNNDNTAWIGFFLATRTQRINDRASTNKSKMPGVFLDEASEAKAAQAYAKIAAGDEDAPTEVDPYIDRNSLFSRHGAVRIFGLKGERVDEFKKFLADNKDRFPYDLAVAILLEGYRHVYIVPALGDKIDEAYSDLK